MVSSAAKIRPSAEAERPVRPGAAFAMTVGAGLILALFVKPIRRLMGGVHQFSQEEGERIGWQPA
jgi:hypothetical protein